MSATNERRVKRRRFLQLCAAAALPLPAAARGAGARLAIVGGGYGGVAAARLLAKRLPAARITLITAERQYRVPPYSNLALVDTPPPASQWQTYDTLAGVNIVHAVATTLSGGSVMLHDGASVPFDRAVIAPGIGFDYAQVEGVSAATANRVPHGYRGSVATLRQQLRAMPEHGTFIIIPPPPPYRCSPAPYERAGLVAAYCDQHKPDAKVLILDQKEHFAQQTLFSDYWDLHHRDRIEWLSGEGGGAVEAINPRNNTVITEFGEEHGDVINYIPPQRAGDIAVRAGLTDAAGWCPVNPTTMESTRQPGVHVIGDAAALPLAPKSGSCAISQAAVAAAAIAQSLGVDAPLPDKIDSTCYSHITPTLAFSEHSSYALTASGLSRLRLDLTPRHTPEQALSQIAQQGRHWHTQTIAGLFG